MSAQFSLPLQQVIPGQLIGSALWNSEWNNLNTNFIPAGMDSYSDTDAQMQVQTNPYPGSVTSHASSLAGELERLRYMLSLLSGKPFWYQAPDTSIATLFNNIVPIGAIIDYTSPTAPSANFRLADGTAISRVTYPALFTLYNSLSTPLVFGTGDGSTTFNLPNLIDKMIIAAGSLYNLGDTGGARSNTPILTDPGHNHTQNSHTHTDSGHNHSTPSHTHMLSSGAIVGNTAVNSENVIINGAGNLATASSGGAAFGRASATTVSGGGSSTGTGTASISTVTPTNNPSSTGMSISTIPTLPPYMSLYKMIRVL